MIERFPARMLLFLLSGRLLLPLASAEPVATTPSSLAANLKSNGLSHAISPGPLDGQIALVTARMLEKYHYLRQPFDRAVSSKFLDRYLEMFDPQRLHFLATDLADFEQYRTNLDHLTLPEHGAPDARPACDIFNRFVERLQQRVSYVDGLLQNEKFTFDTDERVVFNRKDLPYPKDLAEAKELWRSRLRAEYLQEKLGN